MASYIFRHEAMATFFEIVIADQPERYAAQAAAAAFRELDRLETELSRFIESSDIARANRLLRGATMMLGEATLDCLVVAADVALATQRAFDPSYGSDRGDLGADALPFTLDPAAHTLTSLVPRLRLDLGAVGKGFALDRMSDVLREWHIAAACLNSGGSTALALAPAEDSTGWPVSFGNGAKSGVQTIALHDAALSGSGIAVQGSHLIDPRAGTAAVRLTRTWALAATAAESDALSTAFFVMGDSEIAAFCVAHPRIGAALVSAEGQTRTYGALA
jgi:FAD:protein FMN transferase